MNVLLVNMPFMVVDRPSIGLSLLQAHLRGRGIGCDIRYLNLEFATRVGIERYDQLLLSLSATQCFGGDWAFAEALYGPRPEVDAEFLDGMLPRWYGAEDVAWFRSLRDEATAFVEESVRSEPWADYDIVGFSSIFEQNIAALALARRVKEHHPEVTVVFGGANWEGDMGLALHESFPFVDYSCSGEADRSFPALVDAVERGTDVAAIPGIVYRDRGRSCSTGPARRVENLDELPIPVFDDFFEQSRRLGVDNDPCLPLEGARGCWWGARSQCTFCGLNGEAMAFRAKSADRMAAEFAYLRDRHGISHFQLVDNILDMRFFRSLLPRLADELPGLDLFCEVKANLTRHQVAVLAAAGARNIQPGIESLSDGPLKLMRKGTTTLQNLQLLKWCREFGIRPHWSILYGFPGEDPVDYEVMVSLIRVITHLDPPMSASPVRLDRFSPHHADPAAFGLVDVRPKDAYHVLYPVAPDVLERIAYYFDHDYAEGRGPVADVGPLEAAVEAWTAAAAVPDRGGLWLDVEPTGDVRLTDTRAGRRPRRVTLKGWKATVYLACDRARGMEDLRAAVGSEDGGTEGLETFVTWGVRHGLFVERGGRVLALAVTRGASVLERNRSDATPHAELALKELQGTC